MYSSNSRRFNSFFVPTNKTKGQLGALSILLSHGRFPLYFTTDIFSQKLGTPFKKLFLLLIPPLLNQVNQRPVLSQISQKSFGDGETSPAFCFKLPFLLSNGQNDAGRHGFVITRAKKEAPATTTSAWICISYSSKSSISL